MSTQNTVNVGNIEDAKRIWVGEADRLLFWPQLADGEADAPDNASRLFGFYSDDDNGEFYLFWEEDCYCPPQYLIRARSFEDAYEVFVEEFATTLDDCDLADYSEYDEHLYYVSRGAVDTESINGCEVKVVRVDC